MTLPDPLAAAVDVLCAEHTVRVDRDDAAVAELLSNARAVASALDKDVPAQRRQILRLADRAAGWGRGHAVQPSLLAALREAADPMGGTENDRPGSSVKIPINADAVDLLDRIRGTVRDAMDLHGLDPRADHGAGVDPIHGDLRRLVVAHWASLDRGPEQRDRLAERLGRYAASIRTLLDPDPQERSMRDAPCQACGAVTIREVRDGEEVVTPALRADLSGGLLRGIECRCCLHYIWRETDAAGNPVGALADLAQWVSWHRDQAAFAAASRRAQDRAVAEARYPTRETA